jgi:hypothetical protein
VRNILQWKCMEKGDLYTINGTPGVYTNLSHVSIHPFALLGIDFFKHTSITLEIIISRFFKNIPDVKKVAPGSDGNGVVATVIKSLCMSVCLCCVHVSVYRCVFTCCV